MPGLYLYDDRIAREWQPFALTRPVGELMLGAHTFRRRAELRLGQSCDGHIAAAHLRGFEEPDASPVVLPGDVDASRPRLFLSSRAVLAWGAPLQLPARSTTLVVNGNVAGCIVAAGEAGPAAEWFDEPHRVDGSADFEVEGRMVDRVWDLVAQNARQLTADIEAAIAARGAAASRPPEAVQYAGPREGAVLLGDDVTLEPGVVFDVTAGPIWLDDGVTVRSFTRLAGPVYAGPGSTLLGGPFTAVSIGPVCKVHGEVEESVVLGYSNKAHDGFLGHAYLGRWVNLGAMTTNSDLKNNYGSVRMWTPHGDADTGLIKLGCLLGDHVKTGIGSLLNTGTVVGAGSNIYGSAMPPKYVPPFSWGTGSELVAFDADKFVALARTVMERRRLTLSDGMHEMLRRAWQLGRDPA